MYLKKFLMTMAAALCMLPLSAINPQNSKMKELNVKKVSAANIPVESVPALLDEEKVAFQPVNTVNWAAFPYTPDVEFRIAHTEDAILLHFKVIYEDTLCRFRAKVYLHGTIGSRTHFS